MTVSRLQKKIFRNEAGFYLSGNCAILDSLRYLLVTTQKNCKKRTACKVCEKRHPTPLHGYKTEKPKEKLKIGREKIKMIKRTFTVQQ